ncbi:hypothetical protein O6H91_03G128600 [Diphasiastrum complanatum]|uniref:Uncharacterized protein n=1 Tax=Diphasiastrum complanatum TaxID=34168 RepID=A0ACC2EBF8_DIPCM|nr:hypothetical protein O6H91_03G128600 [Diphasiastrum complanatum]
MDLATEMEMMMSTELEVQRINERDLDPIPMALGYRPKLEWNSEVREYLSNAYGHLHFNKICDALTRPPLYSCIRVNTNQTSIEEVIKELSELLSKGHNDQLDNCGSGMDRKGCHLLAGKDLVHALFPTKVQSLVVSCDKVLGAEPEKCQAKYISDAFQGCDLSEQPKCLQQTLKDVIMVQGVGPNDVDYGHVTNCPPKMVVVSRKCAESVLRGAHVFVPGVLACSGHVERGDLVAVSVAVEKFDGNRKWSAGITRGTILSSEHAKSQLGGLLESGWFIGKGRALLSRSSMFKASKGVAVEMIERVYELPAFHGLLEGKIFLQNLPSIVTARVLDPHPGERILDMCAAPGGKTTAIAVLMQDKGEVVALDRTHNKVLDILNLAAEMRLTCIKAYKLDALKCLLSDRPAVISPHLHGESLGQDTANQPCISEALSEKSLFSGAELSSKQSYLMTQALDCFKKTVGGGHTYRSKALERKEARKAKNGPGRGQTNGGRAVNAMGFVPKTFDRVLLDAPCSALGLRPRLFAGETLEGLRRHGAYQRKLFDQAVQLVRPGGVLVYSTCTINPGENEALVRYALDTYNFLSLTPQDPKIGGPGLVGGSDVFDGHGFRCWLRKGEEHLVQRFDPSGPLDTIGFFIAKFKVEHV